jgi:hypothetical protein
LSPAEYATERVPPEVGAEIETFESAAGTVAGMTTPAIWVTTPSPFADRAVTRTLYSVPLVSPVTEAVVAVETPSLRTVHVEAEEILYSTM